jgi:SEFIR domain/WD domain, G-beta repeat
MANFDFSKTKPVQVFISYSHDSSEHVNRVGELCDRLRVQGIDCHIDQYEPSPAEGWPLWTQNQIEKADFVLVVCTQIYNRRLSGKEKLGQGNGAKWEGELIVQEIYNSRTNKKFIPIIFSDSDRSHIPSFLQRFTVFNLATAQGYDELYRKLTDQPRLEKPQLGRLVPMPPLKRSELTPIVKEEQNLSRVDVPQDNSAGNSENGNFPEQQIGNGHSESTIRPNTDRNKQMWIISASLLAAVAAVFIFAPNSLPEYKQRILAVVCAALSGAFSFFLSGRIAVEIQMVKSRFGEVAIQSTGGVAVFALVLWWWLSPLSPVISLQGPEVSTAEPSPTASATPLKSFTTETGIWGLGISTNGALLAWSEDDGSVYLSEITPTAVPKQLADPGNRKRVRCVAFSADGNLIAAGDDGGRVLLWRTDSQRLERSWKAHTSYVFDVAFTADGRVVSVGEDLHHVRSVKVWDSNGTSLKSWTTPELKDRIIAISPETQVVAILSASGGDIHSWSYGENRELNILTDSKIKVSTGNFTPDGKFLAIGSDDGSIRIWQANDGRPLHTSHDILQPVASLSFYPGGQYFAAGYKDGTILLRRTAEPQRFETLTQSTSSVISISLTPDGRVMATCFDRTIQVWRVAPLTNSIDKKSTL